MCFQGVLKEKECLRQALQGTANFCKELLVKKGVMEPEKRGRQQQQEEESRPSSGLESLAGLDALAAKSEQQQRNFMNSPGSGVGQGRTEVETNFSTAEI
jgi:hypothetical protein